MSSLMSSLMSPLTQLIWLASRRVRPPSCAVLRKYGRRPWPETPPELSRHALDNTGRARNQPLDDRLRILSIRASRRHCVEVAALDIAKSIVTIFTRHSHRQPGLEPRPLARSLPLNRPDGHDVIKRRQPVTSALKQADAEVLRVPVRGRQQPEEYLRGQQRFDVFPGRLGLLEHLCQIDHARATFVFILFVRGQAHHLAKVLLRQPQDPLAARVHLAVEAFDAQRALPAEGLDLRFSNGYAVGLQEMHAQPFVFDRRGEVRAPVTHQAERKLEDMRGGRGAVGFHPLTLVPEERRLFLRAGERNPEVVFVVLRAESAAAGSLIEERLDFCVTERGTIDLLDASGLFVDAQELDRAHAVSANGL